VRAAGVLAKGRMFDMPGINDAEISRSAIRGMKAVLIIKYSSNVRND